MRPHSLPLLVTLLFSSGAVLAQTSPPAEKGSEKQTTEIRSAGVRLQVTPKGASVEKQGERTWEFCGADELKHIVEGGCTGSRALRIFSVVGQYMSLNSTADFYCGGAHPVGISSSTTIDLHTGKAVSLIDLFPEREVVNALVTDPYVLKNLAPETLNDLQRGSFREALSTLGAHFEGLAATESDFILQGTEKGRTLVRVIFTGTSHANRGDKLVLGLSLKTPPELAKAAAAARSGEAGFFPPRKLGAVCVSPLGDGG